MLIPNHLPARIAMLCFEPAFQDWCMRYFAVAPLPPCPYCADAKHAIAVECVRQACGITSRSQLADDAVAAAKALDLIAAYERRSS